MENTESIIKELKQQIITLETQAFHQSYIIKELIEQSQMYCSLYVKLMEEYKKQCEFVNQTRFK
jgi:hypothetical protein